MLTAGLTAGERTTLTETWVSDTARENEVNHHAVGVGPEGGVVAPVAESSTPNRSGRPPVRSFAWTRASGSRHRGVAAHAPLTALMIGYTMVSLWIVSRPVVTG